MNIVVIINSRVYGHGSTCFLSLVTSLSPATASMEPLARFIIACSEKREKSPPASRVGLEASEPSAPRDESMMMPTAPGRIKLMELVTPSVPIEAAINLPSGYASETSRRADDSEVDVGDDDEEADDEEEENDKNCDEDGATRDSLAPRDDVSSR